MKTATLLLSQAIDGQQSHWEQTLAGLPDMFGITPSIAAVRAASLFRKNGVQKILELGAGQGRDSLFFAAQGFSVTCFDYTEAGVAAIHEKSQAAGLADAVDVRVHDVRHPLPLRDNIFDACYSHMLFCMALKKAELRQLALEVHRVLRSGGQHVYTVRHTGDAHYGVGCHFGENMYETGGFCVHFFDRAMVNDCSSGFAETTIEEFEEGALPRRLFFVSSYKI